MPTYAEKTQVPSDRSRAEIERTLVRFGADEFQYGWTAGEARVGFAIANRKVLFRLPLPDRDQFLLTATGRARSSSSADGEYEQAVRQRWRALALVIKAKLEAVEAGITTVENEFLAHILLADGSTVAEHVAPRLALAYENGNVPALLPGVSS